MALFPQAPVPETLLGYHRILSPKAGVRVSPLCLGAMNFGDNWKEVMGECGKDRTFEILDYFCKHGGNFIDTANNYQFEESETWIGEWMKARGNRDEMVIATKFTTGYRTVGAHEKIKSNFQGNHAKSLKVSVNASLKKLQTDYIDLLYLHWWDFTTGIEELMNSLHALVLAGKVLYLGISDTPAWIVVKCNDYARFHGLTQFSVYQGHWSCAMRDFERDIIPMCRAEGMALAPWGALGRGQFKSAEAYNAADREGRKFGGQAENSRIVAAKLEEIAKKKGTEITSIALAYVMHKAPYVFPIVGGRNVEHLKGNIAALGIKLSQDEIHAIEDATPFDVGFPQNFLFGQSKDNPYRTEMSTNDIYLVKASGLLETVGHVQPIEPGQGQEKFGKK